MLLLAPNELCKSARDKSTLLWLDAVTKSSSLFALGNLSTASWSSFTGNGHSCSRRTKATLETPFSSACLRRA